MMAGKPKPREWEDATPTSAPARYAYYLAYYELHRLDWEGSPQVLFKDQETGVEVMIGKGDYYVPEMALMPDVTPRAGEAQSG